MQSVQGFLAKDGKFFTSQVDAELYEAHVDLRKAFESFTGGRGRFNPWVATLINLSPEIVRFYDAKKAKDSHDANGPAQNSPHDGIGDAFETNEQQQDGGHVPMSDMGQGASREAVRRGGEEHGSGMRGGNAQGILSSEDLATLEITEAPETRIGNREPFVRIEMGDDPEGVGYEIERRTR